MALVGQALDAAQGALHAAGVADSRREASELYAALIQGATSAAFLCRDESLPADVERRLAEAVSRRVAGWPQAYATGWACFRGYWLEVDRRVLIPRPETEGLVELVLEWVRARGGGDGGPGLTGVDVGTGSGAVAVALAREAPFARVWAVDRSVEALAVARANARRFGVDSAVAVVAGDLLEPLGGRRVDTVVSNPPYVATGELGSLDPSVRDFEPLQALDGGSDGLDPTRRVARAARAALTPGGFLAIEVDSRRATESAAAVEEAGFPAAAIAYDLFQRPRYVWAEQPGA